MTVLMKARVSRLQIKDKVVPNQGGSRFNVCWVRHVSLSPLV